MMEGTPADALRDLDDRSRFTLVEIYSDEASKNEHKITAHYEAWRDACAPMMQSPRSAERYVAVEPNDDGWAYANATSWSPEDEAEMGAASVVHVRCRVVPGSEDAFCEYGLDCTDCGRRDMHPPSPPPMDPMTFCICSAISGLRSAPAMDSATPPIIMARASSGGGGLASSRTTARQKSTSSWPPLSRSCASSAAWNWAAANDRPPPDSGLPRFCR